MRQPRDLRSAVPDEATPGHTQSFREGHIFEALGHGIHLRQKPRHIPVRQPVDLVPAIPAGGHKAHVAQLPKLVAHIAFRGLCPPRQLANRRLPLPQGIQDGVPRRLADQAKQRPGIHVPGTPAPAFSRTVQSPSRIQTPVVKITKVYTRTGDKGDTGLVGGQRVPKDSLRIEAYGEVDELNAILGLCRAAIGNDTQDLDPILATTQHRLFDVGSTLACLPEDRSDALPRVSDADITALEADMDARTAELEPLTSFVLPGGSELNARLHHARTVCRRAERHVVHLAREEPDDQTEARYLNRLSDALFVWARWAAVRLGHPEVRWQPHKK